MLTTPLVTINLPAEALLGAFESRRIRAAAQRQGTRRIISNSALLPLPFDNCLHIL
jgi:hypothetical protein